MVLLYILVMVDLVVLLVWVVWVWCFGFERLLCVFLLFMCCLRLVLV